MKVLKNKKGFTLMEAIAVLSIFSMVALILFSILIFGLNLWKRMETANDIRQTARHVVDSVLWDIRRSDSIRAYDGNVTDNSKRNTIEVYIPNKDGVIEKYVYLHKSPSSQSDKIGKILRNTNQTALYVDKFEVIWISSTLIDIKFSFSKGASKLDITTSVDLSHKVIR
jgi:prepilin-type N-terminal cleavage/methylation domain-containing protein